MNTKLTKIKLLVTLALTGILFTGQSQIPGFKRLSSTGFFANLGLTKMTTNKYLTITNYGVAQSLSCWDNQFNQLWKKTYDVTQFQMIEATQTKDKNIVLMGIAASNLTIIKFDTLGNVIFTKHYTNGSGNVSMSTVAPAVGADNGFIVGGGNCIGANFLIKFDASGNVIWSKQFNNIAFGATKNAVSIVSSGNDYLVASDVLTSTVTAVSTDAAMMRVDANGNMLWYKQINMPADAEMPRKLIRRSNNAFSLLCSTGITNGTELIYNFDSTLTSISYKKYLNVNNINLMSAEADNSAGLIVTGMESIGTIGKGLLCRLDATGNILWQKLTNAYASGSNTQLGSIVKTSANNYVIAAGTNFTFSGVGAGVIDVNGTGFCSASNISMTTSTVNPFTVTTPSVFVSAIPIIVTTPTYTNLTSTFDPLLYCGIVTGINEIENNVSVSVYPNPSNGIVNLEISDDYEGLTLKVSDAIGQTVLEKGIEAHESSLNISNFPDGIYLLSVSGKSGVFTKKIVLQK